MRKLLIAAGIYIGIASGEAVVGNLGTTQLMNYTALGDCVNVAKRLQEAARGDQIIINAKTYELVRDRVRVNPLGAIQLKGRAAALEIYELAGLI